MERRDHSRVGSGADMKLGDVPLHETVHKTLRSTDAGDAKIVSSRDAPRGINDLCRAPEESLCQSGTNFDLHGVQFDRLKSCD